MTITSSVVLQDRAGVRSPWRLSPVSTWEPRLFAVAGSEATPDDPREWTATQVQEFAADADPPEVADVLRKLLANADDEAIDVIVSFLGASNGDVFLKPAASQLATRSLISLGPRGVERLRVCLLDPNIRVRYRPNVLAALWQTSRGKALGHVMSREFEELLELELPAGTQEAAERAIRDIFAEALVDADAFDLIAQFAHNRATYFLVEEDDRTAAAREIMNLFGEASIKLSRSVLDEFERLIESEEREEEYQQFLAEHPVLLNPLAAEVVPKQRLGLEFATDYVVRRHDGQWLLVEIERPQDEILTQAGDFRGRFTHAFGQALDFQHWVDENVAYAQRHMPGITAPDALVVIGRRSGMSEAHQAKLRRFVDNSRRIEVITFDDLLARSQSLYENLRHR